MFACTLWRQACALVVLAAVTGCATAPAAVPDATAAPTPPEPASADPGGSVTVYRDLAYGPAEPGNLLDLHVPGLLGDTRLPLVIWHSGSGFASNEIKDRGEEVPIVEEFTARGFAVASISIRSSQDARFPAQGYDARAAIRYLRESASTYGLDPDRFAFMGNSSGGWAAAFAATTGDDLELAGETGVDGTSSAVQVAVAFFPPTDLLSMDAFAEANDLPMAASIYPHDGPLSLMGYFIHCPAEGSSEGDPEVAKLVSLQECPEAAEAADPATYVEGAEVPIWLLHGLADPVVPWNQSQLLYDVTVAEGNAARLSLVPDRGHYMVEVLGAPNTTTLATDSTGQTTKSVGIGPTWDEVEQFLRAHLG
ncbi:MAG TPA: alpha/beta hydrolase [Candidatus Limnocylindrales bacterium]|nr:alpha/beta hydrolase [Candidatus Limnocylindrales bacterium]